MWNMPTRKQNLYGWYIGNRLMMVQWFYPDDMPVVGTWKYLGTERWYEDDLPPTV